MASGEDEWRVNLCADIPTCKSINDHISIDRQVMTIIRFVSSYQRWMNRICHISDRNNCACSNFDSDIEIEF